MNFTIKEIDETLWEVEKCREKKGIDVIPGAIEKTYTSSASVRTNVKPIADFLTIFGLPKRYSPEILMVIYILLQKGAYENY